MKTKILSLLLFTTLSVFGQKYGNIWQFGDHAGVNFNSCTPVPVTTGVNVGFEGCASICDTSGQLLFYTNSETVWNRLGQPMGNVTLVPSGGTLSQVIIIPKPQSNNLYYIVTTNIQGGSNLGLQYHTIDMSLNAGLGGVVNQNNILITAIVTEQIGATYQNNGTDIWLMAHEYSTNNFMAFPVTVAGIGSVPVISSVGPAHIPCNSNVSARGEIKFSPDASRLAFNANGVGDNDSTNIVALFDFDNSTGIVSNPIVLPYSRGDFGLSFSPDNSKLYGSTWKGLNFATGDYNYLYQFDLSSGIAATIAASRVVLDSGQTSLIYGDIKIGPDGKVYVSIYGSFFLGVVNSPNVAGTACNFNRFGFSLGGKTGKMGLNNYIEYQTYCSPTGVDELNQSKGTTVFPNPFGEFATIYFNNSARKNCTLTVYKSDGQQSMSVENVIGESVVVKNDKLESGIYFYRLISDSEIIASGKFVKK